MSEEPNTGTQPEQHPAASDQELIYVRFQSAGRPYHFLKAPDMTLAPGDWVVVETMYGEQVGQTVQVGVPRQANSSGEEIKPVLRLASGLDMARYQTMQERAEHMMEVAHEEIKALGQPEVKPVSVEFTLDGSQALFFYVGNLDNKDRAQLRRRLALRMRCRVELRFVGPRDQAKQLGGYGVCGEPRCCARFLTDFQAVSIRMAKDQSISMAPTDITGMCGRLRCCLAYEHAIYKEISEGFPKRKSRVRTPQGEARVLDWDVLKGEIIVEIPPDGPREERERLRFAVEDVEIIPQ